MPLTKIYVSGSNLEWIDGLVTRSICGAIPNPVPSGFSGQASGRVWVASDSADKFLYYSDGGGLTRFIQGVPRGNTSAPSGRVYINTGSCTTGQDLWWTTPSGSVTQSFSATSHNAIASEITSLALNIVFIGATSYATLYAINTSPRSTIQIAGVNVQIYKNDIGGCTVSCTGCSPETIPLTIELTASQMLTQSSTINLDQGGTVLAYRFNTGSMTINGTSSIGGLAGDVCVNIDTAIVYPAPTQCVQVSAGVFKCGVPCSTNGDCSTATDGCTECVDLVCNSPGTGGGGLLSCNAACDPDNNQCGPECPTCPPSTNVCTAEQPS
jgi:hypothetical protein